MRYLSVCSGIEAASVAWHPLGWECAAVAEVEPFPSAVLAHRFPEVPNLGDITASDFIERARARGPVQLLVGGTPCQSFSVAGLRKGLADPRGGLTLRFLEVARDLRPRWVVWENVPGVLSADKGRAFGAFLGGLAELGYGWAYRVLDAQYLGVAQRRRRVFAVGCLGEWTAAAAVLLERHSLSGDPPPRREKGKGAARSLAGCPPGGSGWRADADTAENLVPLGGGVEPRVPDVAWCLQERDAKGADSDTKPGHLIPEGGCFEGPEVANSLRGEGFDASEDGAGRGTFIASDYRASDYRASDCARPITGTADPSRATPLAVDAGPAAFKVFSHNGCAKKDHAKETDTAGTVDAQGGYAPGQGGTVVAAPTPSMRVRRLTPVECARLQGFPDDFSRIPYRGKPAESCPDGPRYRALGNSFAVPVVAWIGRRIAMVDEVLRGRE